VAQPTVSVSLQTEIHLTVRDITRRRSNVITVFLNIQLSFLSITCHCLLFPHVVTRDRPTSLDSQDVELLIIDEQLDILVVTETRHEDSSSGYYCMDAANYVLYLTVVVSLSWILLVVSDCAQHTVAGWMYRRRATLGRLAFSVAGPADWNLYPDELREVT